MQALKFLIVLLFSVTVFASCIMSHTSNGSPEVVGEYSVVTDHLMKETKSKSVELIAIVESNSGGEVKSADLRIDLIRPESFSNLSSGNNAKAKELILWVKQRLKNPEQYSSFSLNEIAKSTDTTPAPDVNNTIRLERKDL